MDGEQLEILKQLTASVMPLGVLTFVVLSVILFGITTATESAAIGALGALYLAVMAKYARQVLWWTLAGAIFGGGLAIIRGAWDRSDFFDHFITVLVSAFIGATFVGTVVPGIWNLRSSRELRENLKQATFLTAKTTAMVCWLFVGSALFSAVFALHGGQSLIERWVLGMNLSPLGFLIIAQLIIFLLGWPLEWTENHRDLLPDLHSAADPFPDRPHPLRHHGGGEPPGGLPLAPGGDVGLLLEGSGAEARDAEPNFRRHDAVYDHRLLVPSLHVHLAGHDAVVAGIPLRPMMAWR